MPAYTVEILDVYARAYPEAAALSHDGEAGGARTG